MSQEPRARRAAPSAARIIVAGLFVAAAAVRGLFLLFPAPDSDQAIIGLMGLHILQGQFPIFFWGEPYSGTLESFLAALLFFLFGPSRQSLVLAPAVASLAFLWVAWRLSREIFGEPAGRIALALLAIPPVFLSWNSVLPRGNYVENLFLGTLCLLLALRLEAIDLASPRGRRLALLLGGFAGFAWYMNFQSVHYLAAVIVFLACRRRLALIRALPLAVAAFLVGSLPFWIFNLATGFASLDEIRRYSGHVDPVQGLRGLLAQIPVLLGAQGFAYTHTQVSVSALPVLAPLAGGVCVAGVAFALLPGGSRRRSPGMVLLALSPAILLAVVLLGGFSAGGDPRYLLPLYSTVPILLAGGLARAWRWRPLGGAALVLVLLSNSYGTWSLAQVEIERSPRYRAEDRQLLDFLRARGLAFVFAPDYWVSYPITLDAQEHPLIATPFWRDHPRAFSKYPPYTYRVRAAAQPAYLLWGSADVIRGALRGAGVEPRVTRVGRFTVLDDFHPPSPGRSLPAAAWRARDDGDRRAFDRDPWTTWRGTEFWLDLGAIHRVTELALHLGDVRSAPTLLAVEGSLDGRQWERLAELKDIVPGFDWAEGKLLLEDHGRVGLTLPPTPVRYLRILPGPTDRAWALAEIFVFEAAADPGPQSPLAEAVALEEAQRWGAALLRYATHLLDHPDDEQALLRTQVTAAELGLAGWTRIYDVLSARASGEDPALALRFARRFHEVARYREDAWQRLARAFAVTGNRAEAARVEAARLRHFTPAVPQDIEFGGQLRFLGYTIQPSVVQPGETVKLQYYWQLLGRVPETFWVFLHVQDGKRIRLTHDHRLLDNVPHASTRPPETVREVYTLRVPAGLDAGTYALRLGVWKPASGQRLRVWHGWWPTTERVATIGVLEVGRPQGSTGPTP